MKILFLSTYPLDKGPSQRFRIGLYMDSIRDAGHEITYKSFYSDKSWEFIFRRGKFIKKALNLLRGALGRARLLFTLYKWDVVFVQREVSPVGPPILVFVASNILGKRVIFDLDDAIWLPNYTKENAHFHRLKTYWKTRYSIKWSSTTIAGNEYLAAYAKRYNDNTEVIPTVVNTDTHKSFRNRQKTKEVIVIGWTGTLSTNPHLKQISGVLSKLQKDLYFELHVISNKDPQLKDLDYRFFNWSKEDEITKLDEFDIGIMPLPDNEWTEGKCAFKAIQYMSLEIATALSPVGANKTLVTHGVNGVFCASEKEWYDELESLLTNAKYRLSLGSEGRKTIIEKYSLESQKRKLIEIVESDI